MLLKSVQRVGEGFSPECILKLLKENGVVHGIRGEALMEIGNRLKAVNQWRGEVEIAAGTPAAKAPFPKIPLLEAVGSLRVDGCVWSVDAFQIDFQKVLSVLNAEDIESVGSDSPTAWMVRPNDVLVEFVRVVDGAGKDVFGNSVPVGGDGRFTAGR